MTTKKFREGQNVIVPTKKQKVLAYIKRSKGEGRRYGEIQRYIVEVLSNHDYDEMQDVVEWDYSTTPSVRTVIGQKRRWRGYWADNFNRYSFTMGKVGLLNNHCTKLPNGRWVLKEFA